MSYLKKRQKQICLVLFFCLSYNLYFLFLLPDVKYAYLIYLDVLLAVFAFICGWADYLKDRRGRAKKRELLPLDTVIYQEFPGMENFDIAEHDTEVLKAQINEQLHLNRELQDYVAGWCHEVKIPLAASLLMVEKIEDKNLRFSMQEQLERMNQQLKSALLGAKVQDSLFDIKIKSVSLLDCVRTSIRNNQFFLIKNHFQMEINVEDFLVFTDKSWLVYVLDALISNAIKYVMDEPLLKIWSEKKEKSVHLFLEDHGEGIKDSDIRRIFDKGYIGSTHHNGKYKSTGMGLYLTARILEKLGHKISVESEWGRHTRFEIEMIGRDNITKP